MVLALCLLRLSGGSGVALWAQASRHDGYADIGIAPLLRRAALLARHGYGALLLDTRGHGCSGGQVGKIAVLGESMGGKQALAAAGSTRGSTPWSPRALRASSTPTATGGHTTSPVSATAAWNGATTPRPGCSAAPRGR